MFCQDNWLTSSPMGSTDVMPSTSMASMKYGGTPTKDVEVFSGMSRIGDFWHSCIFEDVNCNYRPGVRVFNTARQRHISQAWTLTGKPQLKR